MSLWHRQRRWTLRAALLSGLTLSISSLLLGGCGSKADTTDSNNDSVGLVRVVNATTMSEAAGVFVDDVSQQTGLARGSASTTLRLSPGSHRIGLSNSAGTILNPVSQSVTAGSAITLVAWTGDGGVVNYYVLNDEESTPPTGRSKLLVFNAARDAGKLDVHLSSTTAALSDDTRLQADMASGSGSSSYLTVSPGTLRLRLTTPGSLNVQDVRLDTQITLPDQGVSALVITPSSGGVLAHALLLQPSTTPTVLNNTQARIRLVSGLANNLAVTGTFNNTALATLGGSPSVGAYNLVTAAAGTPQVAVNGQTLTGPSWTPTAGSDSTWLVWGSSAAPQLTVLSDDNRLPLNASAARIRLIHGLDDLTGGLSLSVGTSASVASASQGQSSSAVTVGSSTATTLSVNNAITTQSLYSLTDKALDSGAVYSVFMLGNSQAAQSAGRLSTVLKER